MKFIKGLLETLYDYSIYYSFDKSGFYRHQKHFREGECHEDLSDRHILVTGGSSGIGLATVRELYAKGATVKVMARNKEKAMSAFSEFYRREDPRLDLLVADLSQWEEVLEVLENRELKTFDTLIFNAGGMPSERALNSHGYEQIFASQVLGHAILFYWLHENGLLSPGCRVVWVSSGGMYLVGLQMDDINFEKTPYDKVQAYANAKRAQVIFNQELAKQYAGKYDFFAMHPGWVDSPSIREALPLFYWWTKKRLRTPIQGADTILWIATNKGKLPSGEFWFDRKVRSVYPAFSTRESDDERQKLTQLCEQAYASVRQRSLQ